MAPILRLTMFKLTKPEDIDAALAQYAELPKQAQKDGKPYLLECKAYKAHDDPRSQGFTLVARTKFASLEDMRFVPRKRIDRRMIESDELTDVVPAGSTMSNARHTRCSRAWSVPSSRASWPYTWMMSRGSCRAWHDICNASWQYQRRRKEGGLCL